MKKIQLVIILLILFFTVSAHGANIQPSLKIVFGNEGGLTCDPGDPGNWSTGRVGYGKQGCTKYGIATNTYPNIDIRNLTIAQAGKIYERDYWNPNKLGKLESQGVATEIFDTGVNCGVKFAGMVFQKVCNHLNGKGKDYPVDGIVTDEQINFANKYTRTRANRVKFYKLLNGYQLDRYLSIVDKNPSMEKYLNSWLSRVNW